MAKIILSCGIFLTFSRTSIVSLLFFISLLIKKKTVLVAIFVLSGLFLFRFLNFNFLDITSRVDLIIIGFRIFIDNILFGVGFSNFYFFEIDYQKVISPTFLQPIHNIFLMILVESGIIGFLILLLFAVNVFKKAYEMNLFIFVFLCLTFFIGFFDHYLITLHQGQLLFAFLLGLIYNENVKELVQVEQRHR